MKKEFKSGDLVLVIDFSNLGYFHLFMQKSINDFGSTMMDLIESVHCVKSECKNIDFTDDEFMRFFWEDIMSEINKVCKPTENILVEYEYIEKNVKITVFENKEFKYELLIFVGSWLSIAQTTQASIQDDYTACKNFVFSSLISEGVEYDFNEIYPTVKKILSEKMDKKKVIHKS